MPSPILRTVSSARASSKDVELALSLKNRLAAIPASRYLLFFSIAAIGCASDLLSKHWVFQWRGMPRANNEWWIWQDHVGIETALNSGALFGMGAGNSGLFAGLSIIAAVGILIWLFYNGAARDRLLTISLASVTGGIFGNLYDRLGFWFPPGMPGQWRNEVRDWILLRYQGYTWPNFNIADCLLVCGAMMLALHAFCYHEPNREAKPSEVASKVA